MQLNFCGKICKQAAVKGSTPQSTDASTKNTCRNNQGVVQTNLQTQSRKDGGKTVYLLEDRTVPPLSEIVTLAKVAGVRQKNRLGVIESKTLSEPGLMTMDILVKTKNKGKVPVRIRYFF